MGALAGFGSGKGLSSLLSKGLGFKRFITDSIMGKPIGVDEDAAGTLGFLGKIG